MTNNAIITAAQFDLLKAGKIRTTGRTLSFTDAAGHTIETPEPEQIHTFAAWKSCGYAVKKGEKAICKLTIWKNVSRPERQDENGDTIPATSKMIMKTAAFFAAHQVEPLRV